MADLVQNVVMPENSTYTACLIVVETKTRQGSGWREVVILHELMMEDVLDEATHQ